MDCYQKEPYHGEDDSFFSQIPPVSPGGRSLATASFVLGILSLITCLLFTVYLPFILGSIAILLALLSKGQSPRLAGRAKIGICLGLLGILLNIALITWILFLYGDLILETANEIYRNLTLEMYGVPQDLPGGVLNFRTTP